MAVSVRQSIRLLELLAAEPNGLRLTDLAGATAANPGSILRLLRTLQEEGYTSWDAVSDRWRATLRLGALGLIQLSAVGAEHWGNQRLEELARATNESAVLAMSAGTGLVWIGYAQGSKAVLIVLPRIGTDVLLHATAVGKAYLATYPDDRALALLEERGMAARTVTTITDSTTLLEQLAEVRRLGYAVVTEEMEMGVNAIAAPIRSLDDPKGPGVGAVSVAGPAARLGRPQLEAFVPALLETAQALAVEWPALRAVLPPIDGRSREPAL